MRRRSSTKEMPERVPATGGRKKGEKARIVGIFSVWKKVRLKHPAPRGFTVGHSSGVLRRRQLHS